MSNLFDELFAEPKKVQKKGYIYTPFSTMDRAEDVLTANFVRAAKGKSMRDLIVESDQDKQRMTTHFNTLQARYQKVVDDPDLLSGPSMRERANAQHYVTAAQHVLSTMMVNTPKPSGSELMTFKRTEKLDPKTSKLYISGHGSPGGETISSGGASMTMSQLAQNLGGVQQGLDIRLASCHSANQGPLGPFTPSTASKLKTELSKNLLGGTPEVSGYQGSTSRTLPLELQPNQTHNRVYNDLGGHAQRKTGRVKV